MELGSHNPWDYEDEIEEDPLDHLSDEAADASAEEDLGLIPMEVESEGEGEAEADVEIPPDNLRSPHATKASASGGQAKNWVFTLYPRPLQVRIPDPEDWAIKPVFLVYNTEVCPETGRRHFQGVVGYDQKVRRTQIMPDLGKCWLQPAKNLRGAIKYAQKEDSRMPGTEPIIYGTLPKTGQGSRNDLNEFKEAIDGGASNEELYDDHFATYARYYKSVEHFRAIKAGTHDQMGIPPEVILIIGAAGLGKSNFAFQCAMEAMAFDGISGQPHARVPGKWWDGYKGYEDLIVNDMNGHHFKPTEFTTWFDATRVRVKTHNNLETQLNSRRVWITSNYRTCYWWQHSRAVAPDAIDRRITHVIYMVDYHHYHEWHSTGHSKAEWAYSKFRASQWYKYHTEYEAAAERDAEAQRVGGRELEPDRDNARSRYLR